MVEADNEPYREVHLGVVMAKHLGIYLGRESLSGVARYSETVSPL